MIKNISFARFHCLSVEILEEKNAEKLSTASSIYRNPAQKPDSLYGLRLL